MPAATFAAVPTSGLRWQALQRQLATGFEEAPHVSRESSREQQPTANSWLGRARMRTALASARV
jgi:hypothetical protein